MLTACPECHSAIESGTLCPCCRRDSVPIPLPSPAPLGKPSSAERWHHTPGGRIFLGMVVSVGLCYGLIELGAASLDALGLTAMEANWSPLVAMIVFQCLLGGALVAGGVLAGMADRRGPTLGAVSGVLSSLLVLAGLFQGLGTSLSRPFAQQLVLRGSFIRDISLYWLPVIHAALGMMGGWIGTSIWKPLAPPDSGTSSASLRPIRTMSGRFRSRARHVFSRWDGPIQWLRVIPGILIAVAGAVYTRQIIDFIVTLSEGQLAVVTVDQAQVAYVEVYSLAILIGGCVAGFNTHNGLKQGMCVGLTASAMIDALLLTGRLMPASPGIYPVISTLFLGPLGGWFASELLPPVQRRRGRLRRWA